LQVHLLMPRKTSYGTCQICDARVGKAATRKHLRSCLASEEGGDGRPGRLLWLRIQDAHGPLYWLDVEVKAGSRLSDLDGFLRYFWLECCGHLSAFEVDGVRYQSDSVMDFEFEPGELLPGSTDRGGMSARIGDVLAVGVTGRYEYDYGSSTELKFTVVAEREGKIGSDPLRLLAYNEEPEWKCGVCGEPAMFVDAEPYGFEAVFYCDEHSSEAEDEDMLLPVVNSPRMGVCGYTG
jgi:hypothetical protein